MQKIMTIESGYPSEDTRGYHRALGQFATGVAIITANHNNQLAGVTANSFSSVSLAPPLILWSLSKISQGLPIFEQAECFAVNVLAADEIDMANRFSRSGIDTFANVLWKQSLGGSPLFPGVGASFECGNHALTDVGDHFIHLGRVDRYTRTQRDVMLSVQGRFGLSIDYPNAESKKTTRVIWMMRIRPCSGNSGVPTKGCHAPSRLSLIGWSRRSRTDAYLR